MDTESTVVLSNLPDATNGVDDENHWVFMDASEVRTGSPFCDLFPIRTDVLKAITDSMRSDGFHISKPIEVWRQSGLVIDGHTRLKAARTLNLGDVPVCFLDFPNEDVALQYSIANQRDRRNMTDADLLRCIEVVDQRNKVGRKSYDSHVVSQIQSEKNDTTLNVSISSQLASSEANCSSNKSAKATASIVGTSRAKVERARSILSSDDPSFKEQVLVGESINKVSQKARASKQYNKSKKEKSKKRKTKRSAYIPVVPDAVESNGIPLDSSSFITLTPEDEAWLSGFPLRSRVVRDRFDESAVIYRALKPFFDQAKEDLRRLIGARSGPGRSLLHWATDRLIHAGPIESWVLCTKCRGEGCGPCHQGGFTIPGI